MRQAPGSFQSLIAMENKELTPHLFRTEFSMITAVMCRHFGIAHMETAEDIAGDTFLAALESWPRQGIPANPVAWLYTVAKNEARNIITREITYDRKSDRESKHPKQLHHLRK